MSRINAFSTGGSLFDLYREVLSTIFSTSKRACIFPLNLASTQATTNGGVVGPSSHTHALSTVTVPRRPAWPDRTLTRCSGGVFVERKAWTSPANERVVIP